MKFDFSVIKSVFLSLFRNMDFFLRVCGLIAESEKPSLFSRVRGISILLLSGFGFGYELINTLNNYTLKDHAGINNIADAVNLSQYPLKTSTTMVILFAFWWKSSAIVRLRNEIYGLTEFPMKPSRIKTIIRIVTFATFLLNNVVLIGYRIVRILASQTSPGKWHFTTFPWVPVNLMEEQLINLFMRNFTENLRVLCSGYLAIVLYDFHVGPASDCREILSRSISSSDKKVQLTKFAMERAWNRRELSLELADTIQAELGPLLTLILIADAVSVNANFSDFLFAMDALGLVRDFAGIAMYICSFLCVTGGLVSLYEEVRPHPFFKTQL